MNKIKVIGLGLFFSLVFVACDGGSGVSPVLPDIIDPVDLVDPPGEIQTLSASPGSLSFTYGETDFKTLEVTSDKAGKGKYSVTSSNNAAVATAISNSVGLVRVTPIGVGDAIITVKREGDASYDSAETEITITVKPQEQNLKVNLGTTTSDRWKLSKYATATISIAARSVGGVKGDGDLVGSENDYSVENSNPSVVTATVSKAADVKFGELTIEALTAGDATVTVSRAGDGNYKEGNVVIFITVNEDATQVALDFTNTGTGSTTDVTFDGYGETANKNIRVTGGTTGDVVVTSSHPDVVTVPTGIVSNGEITITPLSSGTAVITVTRKGGVSSDGVTTYNPISKDIRVSVNKPAAQTLTLSKSSFTEDYNKLDDTTSSTVSGSSSTGDYYLKSSKPGVATASIIGDAITVVFEQVGTTDITIIRAGDYGYRISDATTIVVEVTKAAQTLAAQTLAASPIIATYVVGGDTTSITITGGEGTGSFYEPSSDDETVATASITDSGTLTIELLEVGTTNITVRKRGDRNYKDSNPLKIAVTINKAPQTISIEGGETSFQQQLGSDPVTVAILGAKGEGIYTEPIVVSTPVAPVVASASIAGNELTLTVLELGSAVVTFRRNGDRNYVDSNLISIKVEVTTQENQKLTLGVTEVTGLTVTYEDAEVTGLTVTYQETISADVSIGTDATGTGNAIEARSDDESVAGVTIIDATSIKITFVDAGETTISVYRAGNTNFNPSRTRSIKVTVEQASQTIAVATTDVTLSYGETFKTPLSRGFAGYEIESIEPEGVVTADIDGVNSMLIIDTRNGKSGTAEIKVFASSNDNYEKSESKLIKFTVNKAAQVLRADPSTFSLVYNDTTTSALTTTASSFTGEGKYVVSNNTNIVTTDIDPKSGKLSLRAVGVTDTTVTITITKQQDIRYEAATIEIAITKVIRADQPLASSVIGRLSFDEPGDTTTVTISDGLSGGVYKAISDNEAIVRAAITAGSLSITAVATGDTIVRIVRATGDNYNAADLAIAVRVKKQQTLSSVGAVSVKYKYKNSQSAGRITGGQGTAGYQSSSTPTGIVTTDVDANGVLFITTVSTGDTTISIYKEGDAAYNRSATVDLSVSVARGVVALKYETDTTTVEYHPTDESIIKLRPLTDIRDTVFTYTVTTSDNKIAGGSDNKIEVELGDNASIEVTTVNADPQPATIMVTRARTPYYEKATADIFVTVEKADLALVYDNPSPKFRYKIGGDTKIVNPIDSVGASFIYTVTDITRKEYMGIGGISYTVLTAPSKGDVLSGGSITVKTLHPSDITPTIIRVTRTGNSNYNDATIDIFVRVFRAEDLEIVYENPHRVLTYKSGGDATTFNLVKDTPVGSNFIYTVSRIFNNDHRDDSGNYTVFDIDIGDVLANSSLTVTADNASSGAVSIEVTRMLTPLYSVNSVTISITVNKANLPNIDYKYSETNIPIPSSGEVTVDFFTSRQIEPFNYQSGTYNLSFTTDTQGVASLEEGVDGLKEGIINIVSETLNPVSFRVTWEGRNYEGSRIFEVTTSKKTPIFAYDSTTVELPFGGASMDVIQTPESIDDIRLTDREDARFSLDYDTDIISAVENSTANSSRTIRITPLEIGTTTLRVEKTFVNDSIDYYNSVSTELRVNVSGFKLYHVASTDAVLGAYSGLTTVASGDSDYLFIAGQPISGRKVSNAGIFSSTIGGAITASADSITSAQIEDNTYIFTANRGTSTVTVYSFANGSLNSADIVENDDDPGFNIGGASALTTAIIDSRLFLFVAGSGDNGVSVFEVDDNDGTLTHKTSVTDTPIYELSGASALTTAVLGSNNATFLFVAGKDDNGVSSFRVDLDTQGEVTLVSIANQGGITGVLDLATASTDTGVFLYAVGSGPDSNGSNGLFLLGTISGSNPGSLSTPSKQLTLVSNNVAITTAKKGTTNFLFVASGNRVHSRIVDNDDGSLSGSYSITDDDNYKFNGASSLTTATIGDKLFLFVAGSSDNGVSVFEVRYQAPVSSPGN